jgi:hypothetical protein
MSQALEHVRNGSGTNKSKFAYALDAKFQYKTIAQLAQYVGHTHATAMSKPLADQRIGCHMRSKYPQKFEQVFKLHLATGKIPASREFKKAWLHG